MATATLPKVRKFSKLLTMAMAGTNDNERLAALSRMAAQLAAENLQPSDLFITAPVHPVLELALKDAAALREQVASLQTEVADLKAGGAVAKPAANRSRPKKACPCGCGYEGRADSVRNHVANKHPEQFLSFYPVSK